MEPTWLCACVQSVKTDGLGKAVSTTAAAVTGEPATDSLDGALADPAGLGKSVKLVSKGQGFALFY